MFYFIYFSEKYFGRRVLFRRANFFSVAIVAVNEKVLLFSRTNEIRGVDLTQPYYHAIPTISLSPSQLVLSPSQLDYQASTRTIFWTDIQINEVKKASLFGGMTQSIIDTGKVFFLNNILLSGNTNVIKKFN